ncbi:melatonin receptor type 1A [Tachyglossus aculeatus]|uniref:melatonin receptor type 1A n=1 Tax=Tachyglossus aculeatus TaxID=9261 RepID=UPI0018F6725B|nr:melatonin receptor type 1A [Tachyglossus aculeatus]
MVTPMTIIVIVVIITVIFNCHYWTTLFYLPCSCSGFSPDIWFAQPCVNAPQQVGVGGPPESSSPPVEAAKGTNPAAGGDQHLPKSGCGAANRGMWANGSEGAAEGVPGRPPWVRPALATVLIVTIVGDLLGNALVIVSVARNKKLRNAGNAFVVSLAVADLVVALYPYPLVLSAVLQRGWSLGPLHCQLSGFFMGLSVVGSVFNITAIALNRYCSVCHGPRYLRLFSGRHTAGYVALVWLLALLAVAPNVTVGSLRYDPRIFSCTFAQSVSAAYTVAVVCFHFLLPMAVVAFCYLRIWGLVLGLQRRRGRPVPGPRPSPQDLRNFVTMFAVFVLFALCWAPLNFIGLAVAAAPRRTLPRLPDWLFVVSYYLAYFNSCLNAVVYGLLNRQFRREYWNLALGLCPAVDHQPRRPGAQGETLPRASHGDRVRVESV